MRALGPHKRSGYGRAKATSGYQEEVFGKTVDYFRSKDGAIPAFLDVTVGGGKTALAAFLAKHVASKGGAC